MSPPRAAVKRGYLDGPYGQVHVRQAGAPGDRPPLLCLHMSPHSGRIYEAFLGAVGADRMAMAPDTPGFGMSDAPPTTPEIEDYARAFADLADRGAVPAPFDVIGYHTGAMTAVELACQRPELVRRVIMISAPTYTDAERAHARHTYRHREPALDGSHLVEQWTAAVFWNLNGEATLQTVADQFPERLLGRDKAAWGHRAAFNHDLEARLRQVSQPVLVLNPKDDLWSRTPRAGPLLQTGRIVDLPGWAHGFLTFHAEEAATLARSFLDAPDDAPFGSLAVPPDALVDRLLPLVRP